MDPNLLDHLIVAGVAFVGVVVATPVVRRLARAVGAVKQPQDRHVHSVPTPELGGVAILAGILAAFLAATRLSSFDELYRTTSEPEAIVLAALMIATVGLVDDLRPVSAPAKLAGQLVAAGTLVLFGVTLRWVYVPGDPGSLFNLSPDLAALLTIAAVVAMVNAVNLVDGLDGLAAGIVAIAGTALFVHQHFADRGAVLPEGELSAASLVLAALVGACLGFLVYNFHPASIFMGDTGALLIGLLLAAASVSAIGNSIQPTRTDFTAAAVPVAIPALVLAVPFVDTFLAILRRVGSGRSWASADKEHLHHRLLEIGHSHRRAVLIMYAWSALIAFGAVGTALVDPVTVYVIVGVGAVAMVSYLVVDVVRRRRRARQGLSRDGAIVYAFTSARNAPVERDRARADKD